MKRPWYVTDMKRDTLSENGELLWHLAKAFPFLVSIILQSIAYKRNLEWIQHSEIRPKSRSWVLSLKDYLFPHCSARSNRCLGSRWTTQNLKMKVSTSGNSSPHKLCFQTFLIKPQFRRFSIFPIYNCNVLNFCSVSSSLCFTILLFSLKKLFPPVIF